jgi:hypothetical protein
MNFKKTYKLSNQYFENCSVGTIFIGEMSGFRPMEDFWIGICLLDNFFEYDESGNKIFATVEFIYCKRKENSLSDILNLKGKAKCKKLKLIFKGMTSAGVPIFFHQFE